MELLKQSLSIFVSFSLIVNQCLYAADLPIEVDTSAAAKHQATLDKAPNGVQIVNIVNPDSQGMSHNKFKEYNVNPSGLILNNSKTVTSTQLAGYISYNPNLTNNASVILNEVTGTNKSLLKGYSEVAGVKADVIVANPNGITVNDGGFINTNKVTLTTGTPTFLNGFVNGFDISKGQILIEGDGFNINNIDKVELYSKALQVNAKFYANNLKIATGDNSVDLAGNVTSKETLGSGVSIDSALLGGIYANRIELISSDKGVGVNLPSEVFAQDSLSLSAQGDIVLDNTTANNSINITSVEGNIDNTSTLSTNSLILNAKDTLTNSGSIEGSNVTIDANLLNNENNLYAQNDVTLNIQTLTNNGLVQADDDINITSDILTNNIDATIYAKNDSNITTNQLTNNGLFVSQNLNINATNVDNSGALYSTNDMTIKSKDLTNYEMIRSNNDINLLISNELQNSSNGVIYGDGNINISANDAKDKINTVINKGLIQSNKDINITAKKLENTATTPTYKSSTTSSSQTISRGGGNDYDIVTTTINTQAIDIPSDPALILSEGNINIDVETLNNFYSLIASNQDITLNANNANNVGKILVSTTTVSTAQYRDERYCSSSGPSGACFNHKNRAAYRGTFTTSKTTKLPVPNYGIQAKRNITGNVVNLNNTNGSAQDILTNQEISAKQETASIVETNAISLQKLTDQLDTNNENKTNALGTVPDMNALIDSIQTQDDFLAFKTNLTILESSIQSSIDQDKIDIASIEAVIAYTRSLTITDTLSTEITNLETALQTLKDNVTLNESNITTFKNVNDSILTIDDIALNKQALISIDSDVRTVISDNSSLINTLNTSGSVNTIVSELEGISNTLYAQVKQSIDLQAATTKTLLSANDGLYQTNNSTTLESVNNVSYDNKVLSSNDVINFNVLLPSGKYGLFVLNETVNHPYLIESNPLYTSYDNFIGSDYMLGKLNYKPEDTIQRLGDGLYETTLVRDSIIKLSGQRYLDGFSSDVSQFQSLMDNALALKDNLKLSYGVTLSKEQIAQLNKDIVWMEERIVDNKKVLVPIVYLATIDQEKMLDGAKIIAGEDINLTAQNDLTNQGLLSSNGNTNIQANNIINQGGTLKSAKDISLNATNNIDNISGNINAINNINLLAQNDINVRTFQNQKTYNHGSGYETVTNKGQASNITGGGNVNINAQNDITLTGAKVKSDKDVTLTSVNKDVSINSLQMNEDYNFNFYNGYNKGKNIKNIGSLVDGNNITVQAKNLNVKSSDMNANETISLNGVDNVNVTATNDLTYKDTQIKSKGFLSKKTQRDTSYKESVVSSNLNAKNILINSDKDVTLEAAKLKAKENIIVDAKGDVNVVAKQYKEGELHQTSKSSWGGLKKSVSMDRFDNLNLKEAKLQTEALNVILKSGKDINIIASDINSAADVQLEAFNKLLIAAGEEIKQKESYSKKTSFNPLGLLAAGAIDVGPLYSQEIDQNKNYDTKIKESNITAGNNFTADTGSTQIIGSNIEAQKDINITSDINSVDIVSAQELSNASSLHKKVEVKLNNVLEMAKSFVEQDINMIKNSTDPNSDGDTKIKISVAKATYDKDEVSSTATKNISSNLVSKSGNININSSEDVKVKGSKLAAKEDINLTAQTGNVTIEEAVDTKSVDEKNKHAQAEVNVTVQNEYVEIATAVKAALLSAKQLKKVKDDYSNYKKQVKSLEGTLNQLKQDLRNKVVGVDAQDIEDVQEIVDNAKDDERYYLAAVVAATADLASKTVAIAQQTATAAASSGTWGFSAGLSLDLQGSKTNSNSQETKSVASNLNANNITIKTNKDIDTNVTVSGSNVIAQNEVNIETKDLTVKASSDTTNSKSDEKDISGSVSMTMYSVAGPQVSLGYGEQHYDSDSVTYNNSQVKANNVNLTASNDANFAGANVNATDTLNLDVGNDLNIESKRNANNSNSNGFNLSAGFGFGSDKGTETNFIQTGNGKVNSANASFGANTGRTKIKQTVLSSVTGEKVNVTTGNNTNLKGSLLAAGSYDENGNFVDNENLNLKTKTLTYSNSTDSLYQSSNSFNVGASVGIGSTKDKQGNEKTTTNVTSSSLAFENSLGYQRAKTLATLGKGNVTITDTKNSDDTTALNRDTENISKTMVDVNYGVKVDATLDHRLLTEDGQKQIKEDLKEVLNSVDDFSRLVKDKVGGYTLSEVEKEAIKEKGLENSFIEALQKENISDEQIQLILSNESVQNLLNGYANTEKPQEAQIDSSSTDSNEIELATITVTPKRDIQTYLVDGAQAINSVVNEIGENNAAAAILVLQVAIEGPVKTAATTLSDEVKDRIFGGAKEEFSNYIANELFDINDEYWNNEQKEAINSLSDSSADFGVDLILSGGAFGIIKGAKDLGSKSDAFDSSVDLGVSADDINKLKNKDSWTADQIKQANIKKQNLQKAAQEGKLTVNSNHGVTNAERQAITSQYRKDLTNRINSLYSNNPTAKQNALKKLDSADIDHMIDLQLGGENVKGNLKALDKSVNRSYGKQLDNILKNLVKEKDE